MENKWKVTVIGPNEVTVEDGELFVQIIPPHVVTTPAWCGNLATQLRTRDALEAAAQVAPLAVKEAITQKLVDMDAEMMAEAPEEPEPTAPRALDATESSYLPEWLRLSGITGSPTASVRSMTDPRLREIMEAMDGTGAVEWADDGTPFLSVEPGEYRPFSATRYLDDDTGEVLDVGCRCLMIAPGIVRK